MATRRHTFVIPVAEIAAALLAQPEVVPRAQVIAEWAAELLPDAAAVVYVIRDQENPVWTAKATAGEITVGDVTNFNHGTLGAVAESRELQVFEGADLQRENFSHLDVRRTVVSLAYVPLLVYETLVGAIELICYAQSFPDAALQSLNEIAGLASPAIATALSYENERNVNLHSISRVTQMYDVEKVFNSTLEMDELLERIAKKSGEVMNVQAINLWMVRGDAVELVTQAGFDATVSLGTVQRAGEGIAGDISDTGESVLIDDSDDERLQQRNSGLKEGAVFSLMAAPLIEHENLVGVVEALNRQDGLPFDEDDQFLLANICETASNALHNASLLEAERKVEILHTLVSISHEIASTLNQERVLQAIVNQPQRVIPYDRGAIALEERGRLRIKAISGTVQLNPSDPDVQRLESILRWASGLEEQVLVTQHDNEMDDPRPETREKFRRYFEQTGSRGFHAIPWPTKKDGWVCCRSRALIPTSSRRRTWKSSVCWPARPRQHCAMLPCIRKFLSSACWNRSSKKSASSWRWRNAGARQCLLLLPLSSCFWCSCRCPCGLTEKPRLHPAAQILFAPTLMVCWTKSLCAKGNACSAGICSPKCRTGSRRPTWRAPWQSTTPPWKT